MKTDEQIKKIVTAAIRRKGINLESWEYTRIWDEGKIEINSELFKKCEFEEGELPILYSFIDSFNWTLFTTRAILFQNSGEYKKITLSEVKDYKLGNFKGHNNQSTEVMIVKTNDEKVHKLKYETGKQSMGAVYTIQTLLQIN